MYPDIIIAAASESDALKLSKHLRKRGIFAQALSFDRALKLKEAPALVAVASKTYSSKAYAVLLYVNSHLPDTKAFLLGDEAGYTSADINARLSYTLVNKDNCISDAVSKTLGFNFAFAERNFTASDLSETPLIYFRGTRLFLTETEAQIVHALASLDREYLSAEELASYMNILPRSVSSYVSSVNRKANALTGKAMIFSYRKMGYSLSPPKH